MAYNLTHQALRNLMDRTIHQGYESAPRGMKIRELLNASIEVDSTKPFQEFASRNYSISYFKKEMRWKLGASKYDESIKDHAKMWESVQNPDKTFNSNYGQYWFGHQMGVMKAVLELIRDPMSRRAVIPMLRDEHLTPETRDTVCTEAVTFHIRDYKLHMTVHMRSSDQIFGLGTDIPTFAVLMHLVHGLIKLEIDGYVGIGTMFITAASSHIYERHFDMVNKILQSDSEDSIAPTMMPTCFDSSEALAIIADRGMSSERIVPDSWMLYKFIYGE